MESNYTFVPRRSRIVADTVLFSLSQKDKIFRLCIFLSRSPVPLTPEHHHFLRYSMYASYYCSQSSKGIVFITFLLHFRLAHIISSYVYVVYLVWFFYFMRNRRVVKKRKTLHIDVTRFFSRANTKGTNTTQLHNKWATMCSDRIL